eukprot:gene15444-biopygen6676
MGMIDPAQCQILPCARSREQQRAGAGVPHHRIRGDGQVQGRFSSNRMVVGVCVGAVRVGGEGVVHCARVSWFPFWRNGTARVRSAPVPLNAIVQSSSTPRPLPFIPSQWVWTSCPNGFLTGTVVLARAAVARAARATRITALPAVLAVSPGGPCGSCKKKSGPGIPGSPVFWCWGGGILGFIGAGKRVFCVVAGAAGGCRVGGRVRVALGRCGGGRAFLGGPGLGRPAGPPAGMLGPSRGDLRIPRKQPAWTLINCGVRAKRRGGGPGEGEPQPSPVTGKIVEFQAVQNALLLLQEWEGGRYDVVRIPRPPQKGFHPTRCSLGAYNSPWIPCDRTGEFPGNESWIPRKMHGLRSQSLGSWGGARTRSNTENTGNTECEERYGTTQSNTECHGGMIFLPHHITLPGAEIILVGAEIALFGAEVTFCAFRRWDHTSRSLDHTFLPSGHTFRRWDRTSRRWDHTFRHWDLTFRPSDHTFLPSAHQSTRFPTKLRGPPPKFPLQKPRFARGSLPKACDSPWNPHGFPGTSEASWQNSSGSHQKPRFLRETLGFLSKPHDSPSFAVGIIRFPTLAASLESLVAPESNYVPKSTQTRGNNGRMTVFSWPKKIARAGYSEEDRRKHARKSTILPVTGEGCGSPSPGPPPRLFARTP